MPEESVNISPSSQRHAGRVVPAYLQPGEVRVHLRVNEVADDLTFYEHRKAISVDPSIRHADVSLGRCRCMVPIRWCRRNAQQNPSLLHRSRTRRQIRPLKQEFGLSRVWHSEFGQEGTPHRFTTEPERVDQRLGDVVFKLPLARSVVQDWPAVTVEDVVVEVHRKSARPCRR